MKTSDFDYDLPTELIAQTPVEPRDASRLMVVDRSAGDLIHRHFADVLEYLQPGDLLVGNNSRTIPARLHGTKETGGAVEIFLLKPYLTPLPPSPSEERGDRRAAVAAPSEERGERRAAAPSEEKGERRAAAPSEEKEETPAATPPLPAGRGGRGGEVWQCLVGGKGLRPGVRVSIRHEGYEGEIVATVVGETEGGSRIIRFEPPVGEWLWEVGETPLPPYIHEPLADAERYQTVYSRIEGSVASSTAGLHFTPDLLVALRERGVRFATVTLHIGLDTFRPVQVENIEEHEIHREWAELPAETARAINETRLAGGRVIAIGTTVVRTLESGAKIALGFRPCDDIPEGAVCGWQTVAAFEGETDLFIKPGFRFRAVDTMITNFHLPKSTLLMLVSAFAGKELIDRAYAEAIRERYRFYSFGDAMLIL